MKSARHILSAPLITEKGTMVSAQGNQVVFKVRPSANKVAIRQAVESTFKVKVEKVHTINYLGKFRRVGKSMGQRPQWKKAYVTLAPGERIDFFESA